MRFQSFRVLFLSTVLAGDLGAFQDRFEKVERELRERAALRLAANDIPGLKALADEKCVSTDPSERTAGVLLSAEAYFRFGDRAKALELTAAWRETYRLSGFAAGRLASGDLVEILDSALQVKERGIIASDGALWHMGDRRVAKLAFQDPVRLDSSAIAALRAHYGEGAQLRAWRTETQVLGVPPSSAPPAQEDARTKEVREHFQKLNLPRLGDQDHSRMESLRRMGPAAIEAAFTLWMGLDERDPVRTNAALYLAQEAPQRLREALPSLRESSRVVAASALLHGMAQSEGIPPALLREEFREGWLGLLDSPDGSVRSAALFLVDRAYPAEVASRLEHLAKDPDALLRQRVAQQLLPRLAWDERVEGVARGMLRDADAEVRQHVVRLLGERRVLRAADALAVLREDASVDVRGMIFRVGFPLVGAREEVEQVLLQGLQDANAQVSLVALDQISRGVCVPIANAELVAQISRFAMQSEDRYCVTALNALEFLSPELLGPVVEDLLQRVSPRTWGRSNSLSSWANSSDCALSKAKLRPSIWLERRPWFEREQGARSSYDSILQRHIVARVEPNEIASWVPLSIQQNELANAILKRAALIAPESLETVLGDPRSEAWHVQNALEALGDDPRGIAWVAADERWRKDASVLRSLGRFRDRKDARALLVAWLEQPENLLADPQREQERENLLAGWLPQKPALVEASILPYAALVAWHNTTGGWDAIDGLLRAPADEAIRALEATQPIVVSGGAWQSVSIVVGQHSVSSTVAQDAWVRWFAPRCLESESAGREFFSRLQPVSVASPKLVEMFRSWSKAEAPYLRAWACRFFGRRLVPDARELLIAALRDPAAEVCTVAAHELRSFDDPECVDALLAASTAENPLLRNAAAKSLEALRSAIEAKRFWSTIRAEGLEDPLAKILPMIRGTDPELRLLAIDSLGALGSPRALPHLLELFQSGGAPEKAAAKRAIERIQRAVDAERAKAVESGAKPATGGEKTSGDSSKQGETEGGGGGS
ncbi:MAG: HEAT repeat domain-containing protein [Planctomycetes bacterium]|nr:HEAT repeat domain-containing protein [Planctomycetota bacterium]